MEYSFKYRKYIARISFLPLIFLLLLALNFKIWGGFSYDDYLARLIDHQSKDLEHCTLTLCNNQVNIQDNNQIRQLPDTVINDLNTFPILLTLICFFLLCWSRLNCKFHSTLISLRVRMNN